MWSVTFFVPLMMLVVSLVAIPVIEGNVIIINWPISLGEMEMTSTFLIDHISIQFFFIVSFVSLVVLVYSNSYMKSEVFKKKFILSMLVFIFSMIILSFSGDLFWLMIGWDGLGLSSFYLIAYFQNWKSFNSAMFTFLSNRVGDCFILLTFGWIVGSCSYSWVEGEVPFIISFFLMMAAFSKSAQFPFSAWLPLAMAAPTPVSSLVHSSTLVTAGVFMMIRFSVFFTLVKEMIFIFSLFTIILAGLSSMSEIDIKKIIALSTLSHIGLMVFFTSLDMKTGAMVHLMIHALFKSLLFMISGAIIHSNNNVQDLRKLSLSKCSYPMGVALVVSLFSMMGLPFLSGFISKEILYSLVMSKNYVSLIGFYLAIFFTSAYSMRILFSLFFNFSPINQSISTPIEWWVFSVMGSSSILGGTIIKSISFNLEGEFYFFPESKLTLFFLLFLGCWMIFFVQPISMFPWMEKFFSNMWMIQSFSLIFQMSVWVFSWWSIFKMDSKGVLDSILSKESLKFGNLFSDILKLMINPLQVLEMFMVMSLVCILFF